MILNKFHESLAMLKTHEIELKFNYKQVSKISPTDIVGLIQT